MYNRKNGRFGLLVSRSADGGDDCRGMPGKSRAPRCYCSGSGRRSVVPWSVVVGSRIGRSTTKWTVDAGVLDVCEDNESEAKSMTLVIKDKQRLMDGGRSNAKSVVMM